MLFSVDLVLERFGGLEYGSVAGRDINSRTVSRVAALTRVTVLAGEGAEASQGNGIMGCQGIHDRVEHAVHNSSNILLDSSFSAATFLISSVLFILIISFIKMLGLSSYILSDGCASCHAEVW